MKVKDLPAPPVQGRTYIAGPMTLFKEQDWNRAAFADMAKRLRDAGIDTINPHELHDADENVPWHHYMRRDLTELMKCTRVVLLPDWDRSRGARLEYNVATALGMHVIFPDQVDDFLGDCW